MYSGIIHSENSDDNEERIKCLSKHQIFKWTNRNRKEMTVKTKWNEETEGRNIALFSISYLIWSNHIVVAAATCVWVRFIFYIFYSWSSFAWFSFVFDLLLLLFFIFVCVFNLPLLLLFLLFSVFSSLILDSTALIIVYSN